MIELILLIGTLLITPVTAHAVDITMLPDLGTATATDQIVAYDSSAVEQQRIAGFNFSGDAATYLTGAATWGVPPQSKDFTISTYTISELLVFKAQQDMNISAIHCIIANGTSANLIVQECNSSGSGCEAVNTTVICDQDGLDGPVGIGNPTIDAGDWVKLVVPSVSGGFKTTMLTVSIYY